MHRVIVLRFWVAPSAYLTCPLSPRGLKSTFLAFSTQGLLADQEPTTRREPMWKEPCPQSGSGHQLEQTSARDQQSDVSLFKVENSPPCLADEVMISNYGMGTSTKGVGHPDDRERTGFVREEVKVPRPEIRRVDPRLDNCDAARFEVAGEVRERRQDVPLGP